MYSLDQIADMIDAAPRVGGKGHRFVRLSDMLAREISVSLRRQANREPPNSVPVERRTLTR